MKKRAQGRFAQLPGRQKALFAWAGTTMLLSASASGLAAAPPDFSQLKPTPSKSTAASSSPSTRSAALVPAGKYPLGRESDASNGEPAHFVELDRFWIDTAEVTNSAFATYLNALRLDVQGTFEAGKISSRHAAPSVLSLLSEGEEGSGLYPIIALDDDEVRIGLVQGRFTPSRGFENHPVAETTWAGARAYCLWRGGDLPTEAQWEAAARGTDNRLYPWGSEPVSTDRVFVSGRSGVTAPVGSKPAGASPFGVLDMAASLAEWTRSLKRPYPYVAGDGREATHVAGERVTRGGDYVYDRTPARMTVSYRDGFSNAPERGHRHIGFRCAAASAPAY